MESEVVFKAMADSTRQRTLSVLSLHELSVSELVEVLRQPQSTVSRHLKVLREAGLIRDRRQASTVVYSVSDKNGATREDLSERMLEWIAEQGLEPALRGRLDGVLRRRRDMSNQFFGRIGRRWDAIREEAFGTAFHLEALLALLPRDWTVVDVGTGTGYLLPLLASRFKRVIGVDPVDEMLEAADYRLRAGGVENVELRKGDLSKLPIVKRQADLVLAVLVLHHVPSATQAIGELYRIARENGHVLIVEQTVHDNEGFRERMHDRLWGFSREELAQQVESAGFVEVRHGKLTTVVRAADAPELFVVTGRRPVLN